MSTHSTIALELSTGTVKQIYSHSDGYLSYNGRILFEHYSDPNKLAELIALGDLSVLGVEIGQKINFSDRMIYNQARQAVQCRAYGRDRGETNIDAQSFPNFEIYRTTHQRQHYTYILRNDGKWYVAVDDTFAELVGELNAENFN